MNDNTNKRVTEEAQGLLAETAEQNLENGLSAWLTPNLIKLNASLTKHDLQKYKQNNELILNHIEALPLGAALSLLARGLAHPSL